jgi:hypothetical protein
MVARSCGAAAQNTLVQSGIFHVQLFKRRPQRLVCQQVCMQLLLYQLVPRRMRLLTELSAAQIVEREHNVTRGPADAVRNEVALGLRMDLQLVELDILVPACDELHLAAPK